MRSAAALILVAVLGAGCTEDRPVRIPEPAAASPEAGLPRCEASLGPPPDGFLLLRSREIRYPDHLGVREEYEHEDGRLLVHLLGITGEMGEGATVVEDVELASGEPATLFGSGGDRGWSVVWVGEHPCPQLAVVGNGFTRDEFLSAMTETGVLASTE